MVAGQIQPQAVHSISSQAVTEACETAQFSSHTGETAEDDEEDLHSAQSIPSNPPRLCLYWISTQCFELAILTTIY